MTTYRIKQIGSLGTSWVIERDGIITRSGPSAAALGAYLDALLACASEYDAGDIAEAITAQPAPTYGERLAVISPSGQPEPSRDPFNKA
jgi:hypothetical protein